MVKIKIILKNDISFKYSVNDFEASNVTMSIKDSQKYYQADGISFTIPKDDIKTILNSNIASVEAYIDGEKFKFADLCAKSVITNAFTSKISLRSVR